MQHTNNQNSTATAFISCSLRKEDENFVNWIIEILRRHRIRAVGTVGKLSAAPTSTAELMRANIPLADMVVVVATPRYFQKDINQQTTTKAMSEMLHVECGMAYMANKPVVVFVKKETGVGNFLPTITQYIILDGTKEDLRAKWSLIGSLLKNARIHVQKAKQKAQADAINNFLMNGALFWGGVKLLESIGSGD